MVKTALLKNTFREIRRSPGRFLAIFGIIALGSGFFVGLRVTRDAIVQTANRYLTESAFYDFAFVSTLGYSGTNVEKLKEEGWVTDAEGAFRQDALVPGEGEEYAYSFLSLPERVNVPVLKEGRLPERSDECMVDHRFDFARIGDTITLSDTNEEDTLEVFKERSFTVTGRCVSPLYLNFERGNTSLASGMISGFIYVPADAFDADYYTMVYVSTAEMGEIYSTEYTEQADALSGQAEQEAKTLADERYGEVVEEANEELQEGEKEYDDALKEYREEKEKAERELDDAKKELEDAEAELADAAKELEDARKELDDGARELKKAKADLEQARADGQKEITDAEQKLDDAFQEIADGEAEYSKGKKEYEDGLRRFADAEQQIADGHAQLETSQQAYDAGLSAYNEGMAGFLAEKEQLDAGLAAYNEGEARYREGVAQADALAAVTGESDPAVQAARAQLAAVRAELDATKQQLDAGAAALAAGEQQLAATKAQLDAAAAQLQAGRAELDRGARELQGSRKQLDDAKKELDAARRQLDDAREEFLKGQQELYDTKVTFDQEIADAEQQIRDAEKKLRDGEKEYEDGLKEYEDGRKEYEDGLKEYEDAKKEADEEFEKAETELADAEQELTDARQEIADIERPSAYVLGRSENIGYACLESDAEIVRNISNVFPLFFLAVAALICMTTIRRMVEEQRSQIGVLNALGYSAPATMSKYLTYAMTATVLGCITGILAGSFVFPSMIWKAYSIMYDFTETLEYYLNVPLSLTTFVLYVAGMLLVTYLSLRRTLKEVPSQLLRPRPPKHGKRVALERVGVVWRRLSFMWKVTMRNIFRYKERVLMMILGVGGCTALMLTGFGIRDSIEDVVVYQYDEILQYSHEVLFSEDEGEAARAAFADRVKEAGGETLFLYQETASVTAEGREKTVYLSAPKDPERLQDFFITAAGGEVLSYPGKGEVMINSGLAVDLNLKAGEQLTITLDNERHSLTISGVFDNYINNYAFITEETCQDMTGHIPEIKSAFVRADTEGEALTTLILGEENVLNVTTADNLKERIGSIMENMIYIVFLTTLSAAALAFIVIYNLTNINITERMREIATVKVLGFYPGEAAGYVLRENLLLTLLGALLGLPMGVLLNRFVIQTIRVDLVHFTARILPVSYVLCIVLTMVFGGIVDLFMIGKLNRINMAQALKAAE